MGIVTSWDTDAILCLEPPRHDLGGYRDHSSGTPLQAMRSRIGVARALINAQVPFHFVPTEELGTSLAARYRVLYAPHLRSLDEQTLDQLLAFVEQGGRLIADIPFGFTDPWGKLLKTGQDSKLEQLFGGWVSSIHDSRTQPRRLGDVNVSGYFADIKVTEARILARFDDDQPAIIEKVFAGNRGSRGSSVLIGSDLSHLCLKPGHVEAEKLIVEMVQSGRQPGWRSSSPLTWRRRCAKADHYFILNEGPSTSAVLNVFDAEYASACDAITGEELPLASTLAIELPERSGRWIRFEKRTGPTT